MSDPNEHTHIDSVGTYVKILVALLVADRRHHGGGLSSTSGRSAPWSRWPSPCVKMLLVALFFMHIRHSTKLTSWWWWAACCGWRSCCC